MAPYEKPRTATGVRCGSVAFNKRQRFMMKVPYVIFPLVSLINYKVAIIMLSYKIHLLLRHSFYSKPPM